MNSQTPTILFALTAGLFAFILILVRSFRKERRLLQKEVARARCLMDIVDVLNSSDSGLREKMKLAGRRLAAEGDLSGWRCRIVLQSNPSMLPPKSASLGIQLLLSTGEKTVGALIVTAPGNKLDSVDERFFNLLARSLALSVDKETALEDLHIGSTRRQASLLLQGTVEHSVDNKL